MDADQECGFRAGLTRLSARRLIRRTHPEYARSLRPWRNLYGSVLDGKVDQLPRSCTRNNMLARTVTVIRQSQALPSCGEGKGLCGHITSLRDMSDPQTNKPAGCAGAALHAAQIRHSTVTDLARLRGEGLCGHITSLREVSVHQTPQCAVCKNKDRKKFKRASIFSGTCKNALVLLCRKKRKNKECHTSSASLLSVQPCGLPSLATAEN